MNPRMRFARLSGCALVAVGLLAGAAPSHAYRMIQNTSTGRVTTGDPVTCNDAGGFVHWTVPEIGWYHNTAGQGAGKASALMAAMLSWTNVDYAGHEPTYMGTTTAGWSTDGVNTIVWGTGHGCSIDCLALTALVLQTGQVIVESDITFNSAYTWKTDGNNVDTQAVATHELGHSLGIHHTEVNQSPYPTMFFEYKGTAWRSLESDDRAALQCSESKYPVTIPPTCAEACDAEADACRDSCYTDPDQGICLDTCNSEYQFCMLGC